MKTARSVPLADARDRPGILVVRPMCVCVWLACVCLSAGRVCCASACTYPCACYLCAALLRLCRPFACVTLSLL